MNPLEEEYQLSLAKIQQEQSNQEDYQSNLLNANSDTLQSLVASSTNPVNQKFDASLSETKKRIVAEAAASKRTILNGGRATSEEDLLTLNPDIGAGELTQFRIEQEDLRREQESNAYMAALQKQANDGRTILELGNDLGADLGIAAASIAGGVDTLANTLPSAAKNAVVSAFGGTPEPIQETGVGKAIREYKERMEASKSATSKVQNTLYGLDRKEILTEVADTKESVKELLGDNIFSEAVSTVVSELEGYAKSGINLATNPTVLSQVVVQQIPDLALGFGLGKALNLGASRLASAVKPLTEAQQKNLADRIMTGSVLTVGATSAGEDARQNTIQELEKLSITDIQARSPELWKLAMESSNGDVNKAKDFIIANSGAAAFASGAAITMLAMKATGAGSIFSSAKNIPRKLATSEALQEGATSALVPNVITNIVGNENQSITEGFGVSAGEGTVGGLATGAAITATGLTGAATKEAINVAKELPETLNKTKESFDVAKQTVTAKNANVKPVVTNSENEVVISKDLSPKAAIGVLLDTTKLPTTEDELFSKSFEAKVAIEELKKTATPKEIKAAQTRLNAYMEVAMDNIVAASKVAPEALEEGQVPTVVKTQAESLIDKAINLDVDAVNDEDIKNALEASETTSEQRTVMGSISKLKEALTTLKQFMSLTDKTMAEVATEVKTGKYGYVTQLNNYGYQLKQGNIEAANKVKARAINFLGLQQEKLTDLKAIVDISNLKAYKKATPEQLQELTRLQELRDIPRITPAIQNKLIPQIEAEVAAISSVVDIMNNLSSTVNVTSKEAPTTDTKTVETPVTKQSTDTPLVVTSEPASVVTDSGVEGKVEAKEVDVVKPKTNKPVTKKVEDKKKTKLNNNPVQQFSDLITSTTLTDRALSVFKTSSNNLYERSTRALKEGKLNETAATKLVSNLTALNEATKLSNVVRLVKQSKTATDLLNSIKPVLKPFELVVVDKIIGLTNLQDVAIKVSNELTSVDYSAQYSVKDRTITVNTDWFEKNSNNPKAVDELVSTLLHETIHPVTYRAIQEVPKIIGKQRKGIVLSDREKRILDYNNRINRIVDATKAKIEQVEKGLNSEDSKASEAFLTKHKDAIAMFNYATTTDNKEGTGKVKSYVEFPTVVLTDSSVQELLKDISYNNNVKILSGLVIKSTMMRKFVEATAKLFGLTSPQEAEVLMDAIDVSFRLADVDNVKAKYDVNNSLNIDPVSLSDGRTFTDIFTFKAKNNFTRVKGFFNKLTIQTNNKLSTEELESLDSYIEFKDKFVESFKNLVAFGNTDYSYFELLLKDSAKQLFKSNPVGKGQINKVLQESGLTVDQIIDTNVLEALALSAFTYMGSEGKNNYFSNIDETNRKIFGVKTKGNLSILENFEDYNELVSIGTPAKQLSKILGDNFVKITKLKIKDEKVAKLGDLESLTTSIGLIQARVLEDLGYLNAKFVDTIKYKRKGTVEEDEVDTDVNVEPYEGFVRAEARGTLFYATKTTTKNELEEVTPFNQIPTPEVLKLVNTYERSENLPNKILGLKVDDEDAFASIDQLFVEPKISDKINNTDVKVASKVLDVITKNSKNKWYFEKDRYDLFSSLPSTLQDIVLKIKDPKTLHVKDRLGQEGKNLLGRNIEQAFNQLALKVSDLNEIPPLYFANSTWRNYRIGQYSAVSMLVPQGNKFARGFLTHEGYYDTIDPNNSKQYLEFMQMLGYQFDIDKGTKEDIKLATEEYINSEVVQEAIQYIRDLDKGLQDLDTTAITKVLSEAKEPAYVFAGLEFLSKTDLTKPFESKFSNSTDGITNGFILATMQFANSSVDFMKDLLSKGGVYTDDSKTSHAERKKQGMQDIYETMMERVTEFENTLYVKGEKTVVALRNIVSAVGRNQGKPFITKIIYGASVSTLNREFAEDRLKSIYASIVRNKNVPSKLKEIQESLESGFGVKVNLLGKKDLLDFMFSAKQETKIINTITYTYEDALTSASEYVASHVIDGGKYVNAAMNLMNDMRTSFITKELNKLKTTNKDKDYIPTIKEYRDIMEDSNKLSPSVNTYFTKDTNELGLKFEKFLRAEGRRQKQYYNKVFSNTKLRDSGNVGVDTKYTLDSLGVSAMATLVQSIDGTIAVSAMDKVTPIFNVHDDMQTGTKYKTETSNALNEATYIISKDYGIVDQVAKRLDSVAKEFFLDKEAVAQYNKNYKGVYVKFTDDEKGNVYKLNTFIPMFFKYATQTEQLRTEIMSSITGVNQYENEGAIWDPRVTTPTEPLTTKKTVKEVLNKYRDQMKDGDASTFGNLKSKNTVTENVEFDVNKENSIEIFDNLRKDGHSPISEVHREYLKDTLTKLVVDLSVPLKLHVESVYKDVSSAYKTGSDIFIQTAMNVNPALFDRSPEELYVAELVRAILENHTKHSSIALTQIEKLFDSVLESGLVKPKDFMKDPTMDRKDPNFNKEYKKALKQYNSIFRNTTVTKTVEVDASTGLEVVKERSDYLLNFIELGLTNEVVKKALSKVDVTNQVKADKTYLEKLSDILNYVINAAFNRIVKSNSKVADQRLLELAIALATVNHRHEGFIGTALNKVEFVQEQASKALSKVVIEPFVKFTKSPAVLLSKNKVVSTIGLISRSPAAVHAKVYSDIFKTMYGNSTWLRESFAESLIEEISGTTDANESLHNLLRLKNKTIEQTAKAVKDSKTDYINKSFSKELNETEREALYYGFLKTGIDAVIDDYSLEDISRLFKESKYLNQEIIKLESELDKFQSAKYIYRKASTDLAWFTQYGYFRERDYAEMNIKSIAELKDTGVTPTWDTKLAEELLDKLVTLKSIKFTNNKATVANLIDTELKVDKVNNGISVTIGMLKAFREESKNKLFKDSDYSVVKAYTKDEYDPRITFVVGTANDEVEFQKLKYTKLAKPVGLDANDKGNELYMYISDNNLQGKYESGILSNTGQRAKGSDVIESSIQGKGTYKDGVERSKNMYDAKQKRMGVFNSAKNTIDDNSNTAVPIRNANGDVTGFRYLMTEENKVELLKKNQDFANTLGIMFSSIINKEKTTKVNEKLIDELVKRENESYVANPNLFVEIGAKSDNPKGVEAYARMPSGTRLYLDKKYKKDSIYVESRYLDLVFGRQQPSITNFNKEVLTKEDMNSTLSKLTSLTNNAMYFMFSNKKVKVAEDLLVEGIAMAADAIVVKSGSVTAFNLLSNLLTLRLKSVNSTSQILKDHAEAYVNAIKYMQDTKELNELSNDLEFKTLSKKSRKDLEAKIARVKTRLSNNKAKELIDVGIFQNIVEDVNVVDNAYSYSGEVANYLQNKVGFLGDNKLGKGVTNVVKFMMMTHDTKIYNFFRNAAQLSDFAGRYSLHKKNLADGMSKEESYRDIMETFVNYELPTHKYIRYANLTGLAMFTKFSIRTPKVILNMVRKDPSKVLLLVLMDQLLLDTPDIITDYSNPLEKFDLNVFDVLDETVDTATIDAIRSVL